MAHRKRKSSGSAGKQAHAKRAAASDWTSDDSSSAEPETVPDQLEPISDSDVEDSQGRDRPASTSATAHQKASSQRQGMKKEVAGLSQQDPPRAQVGPEGGADRGRSAAVSDAEAPPAQQAKRRGRLRKARASPAPAQHAAAGQEADDIMVDFEDDLPGLEMEEEAELPSVASKAADDKLPEEAMPREDAASEEDIGPATMGEAGQGKAAGKHVGKRQAK